MTTNKISLISVLSLLLLFVGCNKDEGTGGTATIEGHIFKVFHDDDNFSFSADTLVAAQEDVFITYGDNNYFGDDVETNEEGLYRFRFLNPGTYTIFAYSELASGEKIAEKKTVTLKRGETLHVDDLFIHYGKAYQTSMIKGWVKANYFDKNGNVIRNSWAYDQRVYLQRLGEDYYIDDTRVGIDGTFYFQKLQTGSYVVYTFGQNTDETPCPISDTVTVDELGNTFTSDTLTIRLKA